MDAPQASRLDRFLRLFADVRPGEGVTVVLLALNVLLILQAYYVLKPVREALILGEGSAELKSYMSVGQVLLLMIVVPLYARLVAAVPRITLIRVVTWFFVACLVGFYILARLGVPLGMVYYLWLGIFSLMIVAQFWSFANDIFTKEEGERLFPIVGFGASLGAVIGSIVAGRLIGPLGIYQMLLVGAVGLGLELQITAYIDRRHVAASDRSPQIRAAATQPGAKHNPFSLVFHSPYLLSIGVMLLVFYLLDATGEYVLGTIVKARATDLVASGQADGMSVGEIIGRFYSRYFGLVNLVSLLLQLFVVSRIVKRLGVGRAVCILPAMSALFFGIIAFVPVLWPLLAAKVGEKATDYSLNNTVRNMLFLPCTHEEKYSAKQVIDSLFVRLGDVISATLVFVGTTMLGLTAIGFAKISLVLAGVALTLAIMVGRGYRQRTSEPQPSAGASGRVLQSAN
jgi:AAA family ATP:ADP antiporter